MFEYRIFYIPESGLKCRNSFNFTHWTWKRRSSLNFSRQIKIQIYRFSWFSLEQSLIKVYLCHLSRFFIVIHSALSSMSQEMKIHLPFYTIVQISPHSRPNLHPGMLLPLPFSAHCVFYLLKHCVWLIDSNLSCLLLHWLFLSCPPVRRMCCTVQHSVGTRRTQRHFQRQTLKAQCRLLKPMNQRLMANNNKLV